MAAVLAPDSCACILRPSHRQWMNLTSSARRTVPSLCERIAVHDGKILWGHVARNRGLLRSFWSLCDQSLRGAAVFRCARSEEHTSELQSLMRISYAVFCLQKKKQT